MSAAPAPIPTSARQIPGFSTPGVGFEQPFAMLEACHERVQRTLALLERLRVHVHDHGADEPALQAARDVLRYFDIAAPLHHQDEELHVFPPLLAQGQADVVALVQRLLHDHHDMVSDWATARQPLQALVDGRASRFSAGDLAVLERFAQRYARHIDDEERIAYPAAQGVLPEATLESMGREMAGRRQSPVLQQHGS